MRILFVATCAIVGGAITWYFGGREIGSALIGTLTGGAVSAIFTFTRSETTENKGKEDPSA